MLQRYIGDIDSVNSSFVADRPTTFEERRASECPQWQSFTIGNGYRSMTVPGPHRTLVSPVRLEQTGQSKGALMHERPRRDPPDYQKNRVSQVLLSI